MDFTTILYLIFIPLGIYSLSNHFVLICLFASLSLIEHIPGVANLEGINVMLHLGSANIFFYDYLNLLLLLTLPICLFRKASGSEPVSRLIWSSPINRAVFVWFLWLGVVGCLSYFKGFQPQNILRHLSSEASMLIIILIPLIEGIEYKKEKFFKFCICLGVTIVCFALYRYLVIDEVFKTSSGTIRLLKTNAITTLLFPIAYLLFCKIPESKGRWILIPLLCFLFLGILMAGFRSGWIALFCIISLFLLSSEMLKLKNLWIHCWGISLLVLLLLGAINYGNFTPGKSFIGDVVIRVSDTFDLKNETTQERLSMWNYSHSVFNVNPVIGLGRFPFYTAHTTKGGDNTHLAKFDELERGAHNFIFNRFIHEGILGVSVLFIFFYVILKSFKLLKKPRSRHANFLLGYILTFIVFSMFNTSFDNSMGRLFLVFTIGFLNVEVVKNSHFTSLGSK